MSPAIHGANLQPATIRVLVADADHETRLLYRESLTALTACDVIDAADGRDALVKALSQCPALVITEMRLPIFDGYALCELLRRDAITREVPILAVTSETQPTELDRAREVGADIVLVKPVSPDALLNEIQRLLRRVETPSPPESGAARQAAVRFSKRRGRKAMSSVHSRFETTTPVARPPDLVCPSCDRPLIYEQSHVGGVSSRFAEQWDQYICPASCGTFEYRHRTRKLRQIT